MAKRLFVVVVTVLGLVGVPLLGQSQPSIQGVWRITESFRAAGEGAQTAPLTQPQPGYYIFTPRHYSTTRVTGEKTRVSPKDVAKPTVAELQEADRFAAQFGTYEVKGDSITFRPLVLHNAAAMATQTAPSAPAPTPWNFKIDGKTLTFTSKTPEGAPRRIVMMRVE